MSLTSQDPNEIEKLKIKLLSPQKISNIQMNYFISFEIVRFPDTMNPKRRFHIYNNYNQMVSRISSCFPEINLLRMCHHTGLLKVKVSENKVKVDVPKNDLLTGEQRDLNEEKTDYVFLRISRRRTLRFPDKDALLAYLEHSISSFGVECECTSTTTTTNNFGTLVLPIDREKKINIQMGSLNYWTTENDISLHCRLKIIMLSANNEKLVIYSDNDAFVTALYGNPNTLKYTPYNIWNTSNDEYIHLIKFRDLIKKTLMVSLMKVEAIQGAYVLKHCEDDKCINNCGFITMKPSSGTRVACNGFNIDTCEPCEKLYCLKCNNPYHDGYTCDEQITPEMYETIKLIDEISKKCPACNSSIEKTDGCNHMTCKCSQHFCWKCFKMFNQSIQWEEHLDNNGRNCELFD